MKNWFMLTLVGKDKAGIVARITSVLFKNSCNLGEASMMRLGGNFSIMLMVSYEGDADALKSMLAPVTDQLELKIHVDAIDAKLHQHIVPDVRISVFGADRAGIVAQATNALFDAGLDILDLESDVGGSKEKPLYIMHIEGRATQGIEPLELALSQVKLNDIDTHLSPIETMIG
ncbi:MAG: amino acid-binding protein [Gammaproteobacteria bacterium]|nr:amino acid-binding protein [Gammaproteobacteria bacterium]